LRPLARDGHIHHPFDDPLDGYLDWNGRLYIPRYQADLDARHAVADDVLETHEQRDEQREQPK
jgi:hypothetical protein